MGNACYHGSDNRYTRKKPKNYRKALRSYSTKDPMDPDQIFKIKLKEQFKKDIKHLMIDSNNPEIKKQLVKI